MKVKSIAYECVYFDNGAWIDFRSADVYRGYADFKTIADEIWGVEFTEPLKFKQTPEGFAFGSQKGKMFKVKCEADASAPEVRIGYCDSKREFRIVACYTRQQENPKEEKTDGSIET